MTTFEYRGFDARGRSTHGLVEALDLKDARKRLTLQGVLVESVQAADSRPTAKGGRRKRKFDFESRTMFYRELSALLRSGVTLVGALDVILQAPELDAVRILLAALRDRIREGVPLSRALAATSPQVGPFEQAVIEVGERTGGLDDALSRLADFLEEESRLCEKLQTAMMYPCVVITLAILISALVLGFMLPTFQRLFEETNMTMPLLTRILLGAGRVGGIVLLLLLVGGVGWGTWLRKRMRTDETLRVAVDCRLFGLPLIGRGWRDVTSLRFSRVLAFLMVRGVGLVEGVAMAGRASGSAWLAASAQEAANSLKQGDSLTDIIRSIKPLHPSLAAWVQAGEAGGELPDLLNYAAQRFQQSWERLTTRATMLLEIGLTVMLGFFVTFIALAVLLPILQINKGIGG